MAMSHLETPCRLTVNGERSHMIKWALHRGVKKFERQWDYDAGYM
jgi:hypothetical protein